MADNEKLEEHGPDCTCGCHDHDHDHGHGDGHHHDHDHDHEHGPDCTCGCHDHDHHHDHDHEHEHARKRTVELGWASIDLESHMHDQAATVSATIRAGEGGLRDFSTLAAALQSVAEASEAAGAIVGHIKAYARTGEQFAHASVTDAEHAPSCEGAADLVLAPEVQAQLVAIVMLIDLDALEEMVVSALS